MRVSRPRNRTVFFRLSQEEFGKLSDMCQAEAGPRNVSELTRYAVQQVLLGRDESTGDGGDVKTVLQKLSAQVAALSEKIESLHAALKADGGVDVVERQADRKPMPLQLRTGDDN